MDDLISRQAAIDILYDFAGCIVDTPNRYYHKVYKAHQHRLESLPSAQQEIIHCKECKWFGDIGCAIISVDESDKPTENDFCSFAERRTDETD